MVNEGSFPDDLARVLPDIGRVQRVLFVDKFVDKWGDRSSDVHDRNDVDVAVDVAGVVLTPGEQLRDHTQYVEAIAKPLLVLDTAIRDPAVGLTWPRCVDLPSMVWPQLRDAAADLSGLSPNSRIR